MRTLEIRSPSNVAIEYALAPLPERSMAFVIDVVVVALAVALVFATVGRVVGAVYAGDRWMQVFFFGFVPLVGLLGYFAAGEYYGEGQTLGKRALGLRTVRADGEAPTFETYAVRAVMLFVDFLITLGALGFLGALSSPLRQRPGDRIAQTVVVRANPRLLYQLDDILAIRTVDDHAVAFPRAAELTIGQALVIKELIVRCDRAPNRQVGALAVATAARVAARVGGEVGRGGPVEFLRQVLRDYIVLTR